MTTATHDVIDEAETAAILRVHWQTLATMRKRGDGPPFRRVGKLIRYSRAAVLAWLENPRPTSEPAPVLSHPEPAPAKKPRARSPKRADVTPELVATADRLLEYLNAKRIEAGQRFDGRKLRPLGRAADGTYLDEARKLVLDRLRDKLREGWPDNETLIRAVIDRVAHGAEAGGKSLQFFDLETPFRPANFARVAGWLDLPAPDTRASSWSSSPWSDDEPPPTTPPPTEPLPFD